MKDVSERAKVGMGEKRRHGIQAEEDLSGDRGSQQGGKDGAGQDRRKDWSPVVTCACHPSTWGTEPERLALV